MPNTNPPVKYPRGNFYTNFFTMSCVFLTYIQWLCFPVNIHPTLPDDYTLISSSLFEPRVLFSLLLITLLFGMAFKIRKTLKVTSFAIPWFFITLLPVSNILPIMNYMASRYLYIPTVGFCFLIAGLIFKLPLRRVARDTALMLLIVYSIFTVIRNNAWRNNIVFWSEMVKSYPNNAVAYSSLGASFRKSGLLDKAIYEYKIAIALDSNYAKDYNALGVCYYKKRMLDDAIGEFKKALNLDPNLVEAYVNLGVVMGDKGLYKEAIVNFAQALKIDSKSIQAYDGLGVTYARMKEFDKAKAVWGKALEINPEYKATQDNLRRLRELGLPLKGKE